MSDQTTLVYAGRGSSHSWTWLADLFESRSIFNVQFTDSKGFTENLNSTLSKVIVSGGDGFMIADSIGPHGFAHLKGFVHRGGGYVGICAGAYLPLHSSIPPFDQFNLSHTKIENIDCSGHVPGTPPRVAIAYGSCSVIHPVRGDVSLDLGGKSLIAPIYGGPIFKEPDRDRVLLRYSGFTESTEFQFDEHRARALMLGHPAAVESVHGKGKMLLLGPHLEHPRYKEANVAFMDLLGEAGYEPASTEKPLLVGEECLAKSLGDLKVVVLGLENRSFLVGNKLWDGSRFLELIMAIEKRAYSIEEKLANEIASKLDRTGEALKGPHDASLDDLVEGPELLVEAARQCVDSHFAGMRKNR